MNINDVPGAAERQKQALLSVYYKEGPHEENFKHLLSALHQSKTFMYSTGGTAEFITKHGLPVTTVENLTGYPSILGGRVKTLHPIVFGGILARRELEKDIISMDDYQIPFIDLVVVNLYPFIQSLGTGLSFKEMTELMDIGGVALIRAAVKNHESTVVICDPDDYPVLAKMLDNGEEIGLAQRRAWAVKAMKIVSEYDTAIYKYFEYPEGEEEKARLAREKAART